MAVNCAAIPETLLESELFGHEKGAFTGAVERQARAASSWPTAARCSSTRSARCRRAMQVKLLRVLQERTFERVGGNDEPCGRRPRIVAATNRDLADGRPAKASSARISTTASTSSPSSCRRCASGARTSRCSAEHFVHKLAGKLGLSSPSSVAAEAVERLQAYPGRATCVSWKTS